jgi:DNA (cytosine-5)-methyltransferase 1
MQQKYRFRFIDLFAGVGGFHLALSRQGGECVFASELKETLRRLYQINFPDVPIQGDITKIDVDSIPPHDVLCAGFPCQPFSQAGKKQGFSDAKGRGNLFDYICKIVEVHRPRFLFLENVAHLKGHDGGNTWRVIRQKLEALNYYVPDPPLLSPHQFGLPQHRRRIYIICENREYGCLEHFSYPVPPDKIDSDINTIIDKNAKNVRPIQQEKRYILDVWQDFITQVVSHGQDIPNYTLWSQEFGADYDLSPAPAFQTVEQLRGKHGELGRVIEGDTLEECLLCLPKYARQRKVQEFIPWHASTIKKSRDFYLTNKLWIDEWKTKLEPISYSRRWLEWRCGLNATPTVEDKIVQFRESGVRFKLPNHAPALTLDITQSIIFPWVELPKDEVQPGQPSRGRYITLKEAMRLQGMEELKWGDGEWKLGRQAIFEALGNAVNVDMVEMITRRALSVY